MSAQAGKPLRPFLVITTRGHGIRDAADFNDCTRRLEKEIDITSVLYLREAEQIDIDYARDNGGSIPRKYREPQPDGDDTP